MSDQMIIPDNSEIEKALHEFDSKSDGAENSQSPKNVKITHAVEGIEFETDAIKYKAVKFYDETATPKMVNIVMKLSGGAVKEQKQAEWILLCFAVVIIGVSIYLVIGHNHTQAIKVTPSIINQMRHFRQ